MKLILISIAFLFSAFFRAQNPAIDSLYAALKLPSPDSVKLGIRYKIGELTPIIRVSYFDSILQDAKKLNLARYQGYALNGMGSVYDDVDEGGFTNSINCFTKSYKIFEGLNDKKEMAHCLHIIAFIYNDHGDIPKALEYFNKSLKLRQEIDFKDGIGESLNNIGFIYQGLGNISEALDYYLKAIKIFEAIGKERSEAYLLNNIAFLYQGQGDTTKAIEYYNKCLKLAVKIDDKPGISGVYNNLALIYQSRGKLDKALECCKKSLSIREKIGDKKGIAASFNNMGSCYEAKDDKDSGDYNLPLKYYLQAFEIRKSIGDKSAIGRSFNNLGTIYFKQKKYARALEYAKQALQYGYELGFPSQISYASRLLYKIYKQQNNPAKALEMHELFIHMRDSLNNVETRKSSTKKQFQYEYDRKVTADSVKTVEEKKTIAIRLKQEETQRYALYGGLFLVLLFAAFMFNRFKITKKQNSIIEQQKNIVEEKQKEILDSITYAKRLQDAILPAENLWRENFKNGFVFYKPKDIVAGDFYWLEKINDLVLFAVADCTGHGVPGALVSVVCSNALNRSVLEFGITDPGKILDKTRDLVIATFEKSGEQVKDGMDISLCCLNLKTKELFWAGANNPLWYISASTNTGDAIINEIKGNKQPIGKYAEQTSFTTHSLQLKQNDMLYLFTDGIADQFGGPKGKKFKYKKLKELLIINANQSMDEQKIALQAAFNAWKGELEQIDDVCVLGVRL